MGDPRAWRLDSVRSLTRGLMLANVETIMGHIKLTPPKNVASPKFTGRSRAKPETDDLTAVEDIALITIAQRFAPGQAVAADDRRFDQKALQTSPLSSMPGLRMLVAALIGVALLPSLTLAGMFWLGLIDTHRTVLMTDDHRAGTGPAVQMASLLGKSTENQAKPAVGIPPLALTAPVVLEARAGKETPFAIGVINAGALPARSIIAISGLPPPSALSSGRPYGEREWNLKSNEIGGLRLDLPNTASGEIKLRIDLVTADGESLANAETLLKVTPEANAPALVVEPRDNEHTPEFEASNLFGFRAYFASTSPNSSKAARPAFDAPFDPIVALGSGAYGMNSESLEREDWYYPDQEVDLSSPAAKFKSVSSNPKAIDEPTPSAISPPPAQVDATYPSIQLSEFVNLREGPSSSARVIGVMAKGSKLHPIARKRGWVKVTNVATSETGWIYSSYTAKVTNSRRSQKAAPARLGPGSDDSFWTRLGQWVKGP
jgi:hypothetical protein